MSRIERIADPWTDKWSRGDFGPNHVPEGWDEACEFAMSQCDEAKFAPDSLETFYPEDIRYMELRNAFLSGRHSTR